MLNLPLVVPSRPEATHSFARFAPLANKSRSVRPDQPGPCRDGPHPGLEGLAPLTRRAAALVVISKTGGGDGDRTHYLLHAMQALYQLSYAPIGGFTLPADRGGSRPSGS